mmetsp:Transcript_31834/g.99915  ORF Transcript_31834/g.99915 Transcript_31834/m.99915 type:complete len:207 (+) Transcript_31834:435-1055(+)
MLRQRRARRRRRRQLRVVHAVQPCARLQGGGLRAGAPLPRGASAGRHTQPGLRDTGGALRQRRLRRARQLHAARPAPGRDAQEEAGHDGDEWGARHPQVGLQRKGRHRERGRRADRRRSARAPRLTRPSFEHRECPEKLRLRRAVPSSSRRDVCLLKADVEGYEPQVMQTAQKLLATREVPNLQLELSRTRKDPQLSDTWHLAALP